MQKLEARLKGATLLSNYMIKVYKISYDDIHIRPFSDGSDDGNDASVATSNTDERVRFT